MNFCVSQLMKISTLKQKALDMCFDYVFCAVDREMDN